VATKHNAIVNWSQYLALRGVASLVQCFDVNQNLATAAAVGSAFAALNPTRRERAAANIAMCFPHMPPDQVRDLTRRSIQHMFQLFIVESIMAPRLITRSSWPQYVQFSNLSEVLNLMLRGEPAIFVTGHCGNWEALGCSLGAIGYPVVAMFRPIDNPLIDRWVRDIREARGVTVITKWGATPILQETIRNGGRVAFIADQNAGEQGLFVPFFGRLASSYKSIGLLAMRYEVPIVTGCALRLNNQFRYELRCVDIIRPEDWADHPDPLFYITARYNRAMEHMVRAAPEQYLWLHRRWKSRPRHELEAKPMPAKLIEKIEQLPWMTPQERDWIVHGRSPDAI
jgi:KDO2-lipid IV(A) lauroyltransferase